MPRCRSSRSAPLKLMATRWPGRHVRRFVMHLKRTYADFRAARQHPQALADATSAPIAVPVTTMPCPLNREDAIQRQAKETGRSAAVEAFELTSYLGTKSIKADTYKRRNGEDGSVLEGGSVGKNRNLFADLVDARSINQIRLGDYKDAACSAEQMDDVEMFLTLRHHTVVSGYSEQNEIDPVGASQHIADEAFMAGDIDDTSAATVRKIDPGKAQFNRDAAILLLLEAVGILSGERLDERGLAMVDMAGGADNGVDDLSSHRQMPRDACLIRTASRMRSPTSLTDPCTF